MQNMSAVRRLCTADNFLLNIFAIFYFPNTAKASANRNAALQLSPPAVSIRAKIREVRESENVNANRVEFSKKRVKLPVRKT